MSIDIYKTVRVELQLYEIADILKMVHVLDLKEIFNLANLTNPSQAATIESQGRRIKELENGLIAADDVYGVWYNESEDILVAKDRDIAELVKVLILIDTHNLLHNNADQLQIEIKEQIAKHIMEIGL